jgi:hypothetical protein
VYAGQTGQATPQIDADVIGSGRLQSGNDAQS